MDFGFCDSKAVLILKSVLHSVVVDCHQTLDQVLHSYVVRIYSQTLVLRFFLFEIN